MKLAIWVTTSGRGATLGPFSATKAWLLKSLLQKIVLHVADQFPRDGVAIVIRRAP